MLGNSAGNLRQHSLVALVGDSRMRVADGMVVPTGSVASMNLRNQLYIQLNKHRG